MPLPVKDVIEIIITNTRKMGSPIPIPREIITGWADGLDIPRGGRTVIYTGLLYQMVPYLNASIEELESLENSRFGEALIKMGSLASRIFDVTKIASRVSKKDIEKQCEIIRSIAILLRKAGLEFGYLYEDEMYSGVLLYDMGLDDFFREHIEKVFNVLTRNKVRKIITIDPHTTHIMRTVYPKYLIDYDLEVINYLEYLASSGLRFENRNDAKTVIHDPCYYARFENIIDQPRELLEASGVEVLEPQPKTRKLTFCCGGPVESISPRFSKQIARMRLEELGEICDNAVVLCPICYANFSRVKDSRVRIKDISQYLIRASGEAV